jgi:sugar-specific transcriptional regulator TrmB
MLKTMGLNENDIKIYQYLLERGEDNPSQISEKMGVGRTNVYSILGKLVKLGMVEEVSRSKTAKYRLRSPEVIDELVKQQLSELEASSRALEALVPSLLSKYNLTYGKPGITYFEGLSGIKKIYEDRIKEKPKEVLVFRSILDKKKLGNFLVGVIKRTAIAGIKTRIISPSKITNERRKEDKLFLRERRRIKLDDFNLSTQIDIYNDRVAFIDLEKKPVGFIVTNKSIADTMRVIFELSWSAGEEG